MKRVFSKILITLFFCLSFIFGVLLPIQMDSRIISEGSKVLSDIFMNNPLDNRIIVPKSSTPFQNSLNLSFVFSTRFDNAEEVDVLGDLAYIASDGLRIFNISNPYTSEEIGWYNGSTSRGLCVRDKFAYITDSSGLEIINVSDPGNPTRIGQFNDYIYPYAVDIFKNGSSSYAYVAGGYEGLGVVNVTDPTNPLLIWEALRGKMWVMDVYVRYPYIYVAADYGLFVYDISNPVTPNHISSHRNTNANVLDVEESLVYIADRDGVSILDISKPLSPKEVGNIEIGHQIYDVQVDGCLLFICFSAGLQVYDIVNPKKPNLVGFYLYSPICQDMCLEQNLIDVFIQGDFVYFAADNDGLIILKIEDCDGCCERMIPGYSILTVSIVVFGTILLIYIIAKKRKY